MRAGKLRQRLVIQAATETKNDFGEPIKTWADWATVWGAVEPLRGRELWAAREKQARLDTRIRIRYREGVTPKMRVVFGDHIYEIDSVIDEEMRHANLQLMCWEVVPV